MATSFVSLPSNVLCETLEVNAKPAVALRRVRIRSALLKFKRMPTRHENKQIRFQKFAAISSRQRGFRVSNFVVEEEDGVGWLGENLGILDGNFRELSRVALDRYASLAPAKKKGFGSIGRVTIEKSKFEVVQPLKKQSAPQTADGGGGGKIGKQISHGGGDGGDDGGDDDDYFGDFDEGDDGDENRFFRSTSFQEIFDRISIEAVLREWHKTMIDLPPGLRQACEMGLVSTAQMVRYLSINARPTVTRFISRCMSEGVSRAFIGRMMADPTFLYKMLLEPATTICSTAWWEIHHRKGRIKQEWDLALINVLTVSICNAAVVWTLAPCLSNGNTFRFSLQNTLQKLPNNVFERSYLLREFDLQKRVQCFFYKAAELCFVGMAAGAANGALSKLLASRKEDGRTSLIIPPVSTSSLGYGAFLGLAGNFRYQLLNGTEFVMHHHLNDLGLVIFLSTALRMLNIQVGEVTRLAFLGLYVDPTDPLFKSENMLKAYNRPTEASKKAARERLENAQEPSTLLSTPSTPRRKVVKRKVIARS